jgi:cysteine synthase B
MSALHSLSTVPLPSIEEAMRGARRHAPLSSILDAIGNTPLVRLRLFAREFPKAEVYAKLEQFNPGGSVKDRAARQIITDALQRGDLRGKILLDSTSGNTGVGYSLVGAALGVPVHLVMPENVTPGRIALARAFGTEIIFSDPLEGSDGAIRLAREVIAREPGRYYYPDQYANPSNPGAHFRTTGPEIAAALGARLTHFIAGIGTSGTVMGTSRFLKQFHSKITTIAAEPADAFHGLEGLKHMASSIVPPIWKPQELDEIIPVETEPGWEFSERLAREEGIFAGHSAGGALEAARLVLTRHPEAVIAVIIPDGGTRYLAPAESDHAYSW